MAASIPSYLFPRHNNLRSYNLRSRMKLLIVEDNPAMRRLLRRMLADLVDEFTECQDAGNVLRSYSLCRPDWVLMDIELTEMDGITATRRLLSAFPEAKVLVVTNYDDSTLRNASKQAGACGYVLKDDLLELRTWLSGTRGKEND